MYFSLGTEDGIRALSPTVLLKSGAFAMHSQAIEKREMPLFIDPERNAHHDLTEPCHTCYNCYNMSSIYVYKRLRVIEKSTSIDHS